MPLFEKSIEVDPEHVAAVVAAVWDGVVLGEVIKASQNTTFKAEGPDGPLIVRVTPKTEHGARIGGELAFLAYVAAHGLPCCPALAPTALASEGKDPNANFFFFFFFFFFVVVVCRV